LFYEKALTVFEAGGNQKNQINILLSIGKTYLQKGDKPEALNNYRKALLLSSNIEYKSGAEEALENINRLQSLT
jgi:tetratricopeptide (TPR) repeat protein